ncbi:hypothetical protein cand_013950, partial [Cryptosporidium andersoni]
MPSLNYIIFLFWYFVIYTRAADNSDSLDIELNNDKQMLTSISQLIILNRGNFTKSIVHKRKQRHQLIKRLQKKCKGARRQIDVYKAYNEFIHNSYDADDEGNKNTTSNSTSGLVNRKQRSLQPEINTDQKLKTREDTNTSIENKHQSNKKKVTKSTSTTISSKDSNKHTSNKGSGDNSGSIRRNNKIDPESNKKDTEETSEDNTTKENINNKKKEEDIPKYTNKEENNSNTKKRIHDKNQEAKGGSSKPSIPLKPQILPKSTGLSYSYSSSESSSSSNISGSELPLSSVNQIPVKS